MTVPKAIKQLQKTFHFKRVIFVGDNVMNTPNHIALLRSKPYQYEYLVSMKPNYDSRVATLLKQVSFEELMYRLIAISLGTANVAIGGCTKPADIEIEVEKVKSILDQLVQVYESENLELLSKIFSKDVDMVIV